MTEIRATSRPSVWRLGIAAALGVAAPFSGLVFGMPGNGEFVPIMWLAGFVALLIAPGWAGFVAVIAGATISAAVLDITDGTFGLVFLIVAIVSALAAHGALCAYVVRRLRDLGWGRGLRDPGLLTSAALAVVLALGYVWFAFDLARNPA